jgi:hypothetical protein
MNTRVVYVLCGQRNQLCNPAICFATYAYAHPIAHVYVCAYVYLARTQHLLPGVLSSSFFVSASEPSDPNSHHQLEHQSQSSFDQMHWPITGPSRVSRRQASLQQCLPVRRVSLSTNYTEDASVCPCPPYFINSYLHTGTCPRSNHPTQIHHRPWLPLIPLLNKCGAHTLAHGPQATLKVALSLQQESSSEHNFWFHQLFSYP